MKFKEWNALGRMCRGGRYSVQMSLGKVTLKEGSSDSGPIYLLEYPSYNVPLYRDKDIASHDRHYLRYLYNEYMSSNKEMD